MVINTKFHLNKQLELRNEQLLDLNDRLDDLQQAKEYEKELCEKSLRDIIERSWLELK